MHWFWEKRKKWWKDVIQRIRDTSVSFEEKQRLVESITTQLPQLSDVERDDAYGKLIQTLEKLSHNLFVEHAWEQGPEKTDEWMNPEAKVLVQSCTTVTHALKSAWAEIRLADLQD